MKLKKLFVTLMIIALTFIAYIILGSTNEVNAATNPSFGIRVYTADYNTAYRTQNSKYSMEIPGYGVVTTYNMGSSGTDYKTGYTSDGTYTLRQTQTSTGGYSKVSDIKLTVSRTSRRKY